MAILEKKFTSTEYFIKYRVEPSQNNLRLDQYLQNHFQSFSRQQIKKKIVSGQIKIIGRPFPHRPSTKVKEYEEVEITTKSSDLIDEKFFGEEIKLYSPNTLFENDKFIVINKPPFMSTHPTGAHLFFCATVFLEEQLGHKVYSIHRLDRETSGAMILGKKPKVTSHYTEMFEERKVQKVYLLITHKNTDLNFPIIAKERLGDKTDFIPRNFHHCYPEESNEGKSAETHFHLVKEYPEFNIILAFPKTGRQHQIRAHAYHYGIYLLGDKLYNTDPMIFSRFKDGESLDTDKENLIINRQALHAYYLKFPNENSYTAPIFSDLEEFLESKNIDVVKLNEELQGYLKNIF
ncbi:RluA family pseudouridine synthase [Bacteriovoracaceae bacterium]|nr:RluA family pseudouridine synthase [Bacteriovoracaceae bacterium]